jgi:hypothetical protein
LQQCHSDFLSPNRTHADGVDVAMPLARLLRLLRADEVIE